VDELAAGAAPTAPLSGRARLVGGGCGGRRAIHGGGDAAGGSSGATSPPGAATAFGAGESPPESRNSAQDNTPAATPATIALTTVGISQLRRPDSPRGGSVELRRQRTQRPSGPTTSPCAAQRARRGAKECLSVTSTYPTDRLAVTHGLVHARSLVIVWAPGCRDPRRRRCHHAPTCP
jgi:hypothetical protein